MFIKERLSYLSKASVYLTRASLFLYDKLYEKYRIYHSLPIKTDKSPQVIEINMFAEPWRGKCVNFYNEWRFLCLYKQSCDRSFFSYVRYCCFLLEFDKKKYDFKISIHKKICDSHHVTISVHLRPVLDVNTDVIRSFITS